MVSDQTIDIFTKLYNYIIHVPVLVYQLPIYVFLQAKPAIIVKTWYHTSKSGFFFPKCTNGYGTINLVRLT